MKCFCDEGYYLDEDGISCLDVNECDCEEYSKDIVTRIRNIFKFGKFY